MNCNFCKGVAHPQTGCQYTPTMIACASCVRECWTWVQSHTNGKARRKARNGREMVQTAKTFYESIHYETKEAREDKAII